MLPTARKPPPPSSDDDRKPAATRPGVQHVVSGPNSRHAMMKERQASVRHELASLGGGGGISKSLLSKSSNLSLMQGLDDGLDSGLNSVTSTVDEYSRLSEEGSFRPSDEKVRERQAQRATKPGSQQVDTPMISHTMAKQDVASFESQSKSQSLERRDVSHDPALAKRSSYGYDEKSKEEITGDDPEANFSSPGMAWADNDGPNAATTDGIAMKEMQLTTAACSLASNDDDQEREIREKTKAFDDDLESGTHELAEMESVANLIQATLVDDAAEGIVAAITVDPKAELRRRRKVYACVTFGCGCLALMVTLFVVFLGPESKAPEESPPLTPEERYELFYGYFQGVVYNPAALDVEMSPQSQALEWISMVDNVYEDPTRSMLLNLIRFTKGTTWQYSFTQ